MQFQKHQLKLISLLFLILIIPTTQAFPPSAHIQMARESLDELKAEGNMGTYGRLADQYWGAFLLGLMSPDDTIIYYYTDYVVYVSAHDFGVFDRCMDLAYDDELSE